MTHLARAAASAVAIALILCVGRAAIAVEVAVRRLISFVRRLP